MPSDQSNSGATPSSRRVAQVGHASGWSVEPRMDSVGQVMDWRWRCFDGGNSAYGISDGPKRRRAEKVAQVELQQLRRYRAKATPPEAS